MSRHAVFLIFWLFVGGLSFRSAHSLYVHYGKPFSLFEGGVLFLSILMSARYTYLLITRKRGNSGSGIQGQETEKTE